MKTINVNGSTYTQVQKRTAHKLFDDGKQVFISPCKANVYSQWIELFGIDNKRMIYGYNSANEQGNAKTKLFEVQNAE